MSKTVFTENLLDIDTGELTSKRWITKKVSNTEMFVRTYAEDMAALAKCSKTEISVVLCLLKYLDYNTNTFFIDKQRREEICECGGVKPQTVYNSFSALTRKNILIKKSSVQFVLNPKLFFFGTDIEREKVFELVIQYRIEDMEEVA